MAMSIRAEGIAHALGGAKPSSGGVWSARCPCHDDRQASLSIGDKPEGGVWVKCHAGCSSINVIAELRNRRLWPESGQPRPKSRDEFNKKRRRQDEVVETYKVIPPDVPPPDWRELGEPVPHQLYEYRTLDGNLIGYVARWDELGDKKIRPISFVRRRDGAVGWARMAPPKPWSLFGLEVLGDKPDAPILLVEGEKAAIAARNEFPDYITLSWRSGAGAVAEADFSPLAGREVVLWPDADEAGLNAMNLAAERIAAVGPTSIRRVVLPSNLPKGWDVADEPPPGISIHNILDSATAFEPPPTTVPNSSGEVSATVAGKADLLPFAISAADLQSVEVEPREPIIFPFLLTSSLNMVFAPRGVGKTFFGLALAISVAEGSAFLCYEVPQARTVMYIDGEMPLADLKQRIGLMAPNPPPGFEIIPSETLFRDGVPINLHSGDDQARIIDMLERLDDLSRRPDLIIFDNLSSLSGGVNENDNSELDNILRFLMALRHRGYAVLLVHHAGKGGDQRGASRREDLLDTVMALNRPDDDGAPKEGAHALLRFTKVRGIPPSPDELEIWLMEHNGRLEWAYQRPKSKNPRITALRAIFEHKPQQQKELAPIMAVSAGRVSQLLKELREAGWVEVGELALTHEGREKLVAAHPEFYEQMVQQGHLFSDNGVI